MARTTKQESIQRSLGTTPTERYLKKLCDHTFLSLWSYPNVWRDQGGTRSGKGKEVCDLLVVFENHVIIFSDKHCEFPQTGALELDWRRWFKRTIEKAAYQLWGAERWLTKHPDRLFLDQSCKVHFPIELPPPDTAIFHRIIVAHGASLKCKELLGGSGSLMIDTTVVGNDHCLPFAEGGRPFTIGQVNPAKGYAHVFDDTTLNIVLQTLDTIADFTAYLEKKEVFLNSRIVHVAGEEELVALYLQDLDERGEHNFIFPQDYDGVAVGEGFWAALENHPRRRAQIEANRISFLWDDLIESFNEHILGGTRHYASHETIRESERAVRLLAREPRTRRRILAEALWDMVVNTPPAYKRVRVMAPSKEGDPFYVFLVIPPFSSSQAGKSYDEYRHVRGDLLQAYCLAAKAKFPHATDVVGIATEVGADCPERSEDLIYIDTRGLTPQELLKAQELREEMELLTNIQIHREVEYEYPVLLSQGKTVKRHTVKTGRNELCPCGSGKKYKFCCGSPRQRFRSDLTRKG